jgi:hypothetical protein
MLLQFIQRTRFVPACKFFFCSSAAKMNFIEVSGSFAEIFAESFAGSFAGIRAATSRSCGYAARALRQKFERVAQDALDLDERQPSFARRFGRRFNPARERCGAFQPEMPKKTDQRMGGQPRARMVPVLRSARQTRLMLKRGGAHASDKAHKHRKTHFLKQFAQNRFVKKRRRNQGRIGFERLDIYQHSASHPSG